MNLRRKPKHLVLPTIIAIVALAAAACSSAGSGEVDLTKQLPTDIPANTTLVVADQQNVVKNLVRTSGLDKDLPYNLQFANFTGGPAVLEAFRAGTADVAGVGDVPPIHAQLTGQQVPIILARENLQTVYNLATSPRAAATLKTAQDLRGKKIGYAEGTAQQVVVLRALKNAGLTTKDVTLVRLQLAEFSEALGANEIDTAPLNEPRLTRYLRDHGRDGASVIDSAGLGQIYQGLSYFYARGESLTDPGKSAALRHFVGVLVRAYHWINTHPQEWIDAYYVKDQNVTVQDGRRILATNGTTAIPPLDDALIKRQQATIDVLEAAGQLPKPVRAKDAFDRRFEPVIEEAAKESGVDRTPGKAAQ